MPIHPYWFTSTCVIFRRKSNEKKDIVAYNKDCSILGTGFFVSYKNKNILVTAKHVIQDKDKKELANLGYGFDHYKEDGSKHQVIYDIDELHKKYDIEWYYHPNPDIDLAVSIVELPNDYTPLFDERSMIPYSEINIGSDIYYLGYPLGLISKDDLSPIVKKGIIARKVDLATALPKVIFQDKTILINSFFDEGNSGSPIIQRSGLIQSDYPNFPSKTNREGLIGIAIEQFNYEREKIEEKIENYNEKFIKKDIFQTFITYGLGICLPIDYLFEIFNTPKMIAEYKKG